MLAPETPYPYVGSYAMLVDLDQPGTQAAELVRIQWRRLNETVVSFPLRDGAAGTKRVDPEQLIDATPLTPAEAREYHDLDRALAGRSGRTPKQKAMIARRDALRTRMIYAPVLARLLEEARGRGAGQRRAA